MVYSENNDKYNIKKISNDFNNENIPYMYKIAKKMNVNIEDLPLSFRESKRLRMEIERELKEYEMKQSNI